MGENIIGNTVNLDELYRECYTPVFRYLYFRTKDYDVASDLTQSSFLKFMRQESIPTTVDHARRLLFVVARTALIDHYRYNARHKTSSIDEIPEAQDECISQEDEAIRKEDAEYLNITLAELTETELDIVSMRLSGESDYRTISEVLNVSELNARKIYSRAIKKVGTIIKSSGRF